VNTDKRGIRQLAQICAAKGMEQVVMSPGSRCAPLVIAFLAQPKIECIQIVDERSAAFYALGLAQQSGKPVGLICTSGSAVLNYAPAVAEAYYQKIPLVLLTADRPTEWIDQGENQSINQYRIYNNYIKASLDLPVNTDKDAELWYSNRIASEALNQAVYPYPGPVHLNIPLREPLYNTVSDLEEQPKVIEVAETETRLSQRSLNDLKSLWKQFPKKMIVAGGLQPSSSLRELLVKLGNRQDTVVLTESISNLSGEPFIDRIDPPVEVITGMEDPAAFIPDLLISFGGGLVTKKLKFLLRKHRPAEHWHISNSNQHWDTFQSLTKVLNCDPEWLFDELEELEEKETDFNSSWLNLQENCASWTTDYLNQQPFSDFLIYRQLIPILKEGNCVHWGNSTPVRYANLFRIPEGVMSYSNRGISGIDGIVSTAAGASRNFKGITLCVTGDLAFFYDSNAWWNNQLKRNFRVLLVNNGGGNIFRIIPGPDAAPGYPEFYEAPQDLKADKFAEAFGVDYAHIDDEAGLHEKLSWLIQPEAEKARILEVSTSNNVSAEVLRNYLKYIKQRYHEQA
jgi:2-succinyl-5-enolpyruvyl-6-hydroxy-3-cyclohexene-1-carboxylate synthase